MDTTEFISKLKSENIKTWFDLGLFLDFIKENPIHKANARFSSHNEFKTHLSNGGIAFISFFYSVDGASNSLPLLRVCVSTV